MPEHLDCGGELDFAIDSTGAYVLVCRECMVAWSGRLHPVNPAPMQANADPAMVLTKVREKHPDWFA